MSSTTTTETAQWNYLTPDVYGRIQSAVDSAARHRPGQSQTVDADGTELQASAGLPTLAESDLADVAHNVATALAFNRDAATVVQSATALRTLASQHVLALRRERGRAMGNVQSRARGARSDVLARGVTPRKNATPSERAALASALTSGTFTGPAQVRRDGKWVDAGPSDAVEAHADATEAFTLYRTGLREYREGNLSTAWQYVARAVDAAPTLAPGSTYMAERADQSTAGRVAAVFAAHALAKWAPPTFKTRFRDSSHGVGLWTLPKSNEA